MSLRVWLPLTKDLRNQGLDDVTVTNNGATFNSAGKLGGCYKTSSSEDIDLKYSGAQINTGSLSLCGWFKFNKAELAATWESYSFNSSYPYPTGNLIGNNNYGGVGLIWWTNSLASGAAFTSLYVACSIRSTANGARITNVVTIPFDTWVHLALIFNKSTKVLELWLNGELKVTSVMVDFNDAKTDNLKLNYKAIWGGNGPGYNIPFLVNDVRIYDHALSQMEVKELSKGLVLHYPLNRGGWGQENLLLNSNDLTLWPIESSGQIELQEDGYFKVSSKASNTTRYGIYYDFTFPEPDTYTFSVDVRDDWLIGVAPASTFTWTTANLSGTQGKKRISYTCTSTEENNKCRIYIAGTGTGGRVTYLKQPKIEKGSIATPWCPNSSDILAITMGLNGVTEYDCSGFCNNGEYYAYDTNGSINYTSDTPKYSISTHIASANPTQNAASGTRYLYGHCELTNPTQMSVAFWLKPITGGYGGTTSNGQGYFCTTNYEYGNTNVGSDYQASAMNHRDGAVNMNDSASTTQCNVTFYPTIGEWHHYVYTYDGQVGRGYKDGVQIATAQFSAVKTLDSFIGVVIGFSKAGGAWRRNDACYSDFRIYATALSADDVKSLYQNSAYIDSSGNVYGTIHES